MNFILGLNEKLGLFISSKIRGWLGILVHALIVGVILGLLTYAIYWLIKVVLSSLTWLLPIILIVLAIVILIYFIAKVDDLYR